MSEEFNKKHKEKLMEYITREVDKNTTCVMHNQSVKECGDPLCEVISEQQDELEEFDMYAQDINDWAWVKKFVPGLIIYSAGGQLPFQAKGYLHDLPFYFRSERGYRGERGYAELRVAADKSTMYTPVKALYSATMDIDNQGDTGAEWVSYLFTLIEKLEKTEKLYRFKANNINYDAADSKFGLAVKTEAEMNEFDRSGIPGWGHTADQAFEEAKKFISISMHYAHCEKTKLVKNEKGEYEEIPDNDRNWSEEKFAYYAELIDLQPIVIEIEGDDRNYPDEEPVFEVKVPEVWRNEDGTITIPLNS